MNILDNLKYRGLIYQITDEKELNRRLEKPTVLYCGFDPSAESLHLGNLLQILVLKRFQDFGHKIIAVIGGGTGLIGDPSGKKQERPLQAKEKIQHNLKKIEKQLKNLLPGAKFVNNYDWLGKIEVIEYLRDIGKHFNLNEMLAKESVKLRLETGISFTEFNYLVLQAIDFLELYKKYNCGLQIGGSDQWGNITAGVDLIRKILNKTAIGLTVPLVEKSDGTKFGKTETGTIWLDANLTSPYEFYQFWVNVSDWDVIKFIKYFTFLEKSEIEKLQEAVKNNPEKRQAQKTLAFEVTKIVHGEEVAKIEKSNSETWFGKNIQDFTEQEIEAAFKSVPSYETCSREMPLVDLLVEAKIEKSKRQAREDIKNKAIYLNGHLCLEITKQITKKDFLYKKYLVIKKGKKNYYLVKW